MAEAKTGRGLQKKSAEASAFQTLLSQAQALSVDPADAADPETLRVAVKALFAALPDPDLGAWDADEKAAFYRTLILQPGCPAHPPVLALEAASAITSENRALAGALAGEIGPALVDILTAAPGRHADQINAVLLLLVLRTEIDPAVLSEVQIERLHLDCFERFDIDDLALPYNVMFKAAVFGRNRDELLRRYWPEEGPLPHRPELSLSHVLFLEWLAGRDAVAAPDNADLAHWFERYLPQAASFGPETLRKERAAARTLLLRHWRVGGHLDDQDRLTVLGLDDLLPLARRCADIRAGLPSGHAARPGAARLSTRPYQIGQAGLRLARLAIPSLFSGRRRPRVAICVSGQLRGYERAFETWRRHLLPGVEATIFVHSWRRIGRSDAQPFRYVLPFVGQHFCEAYRAVAQIEGYASMQARHPALFAALGRIAQTDEMALGAFYGTEHVILDDETSSPFASYTNQQKMHYKLQAADRMARGGEAFDLHVRLRPDLPVKLAPFDWRDLHDACRSDPVLFAEKPYGLHYSNLLIGDQCAIADPRTMQPYSDAWDLYPELATAGLARCPEGFHGHLSLAMCCWVHGVDVRKAPILFESLTEAAPLSSAEILAALEEDDRGDAIDRRLIGAVRRDQGG